MFGLPIPSLSSMKLIGIALAVISILGLSWTSLHLYKRLNESEAKCALARQVDADTVSGATHRLAMKALEDQLAAAGRVRDAAQAAATAADAQRRHAETVTRNYRKELNDAREKHPELDAALPTDTLARLCHAQSAYYGGAGEDCSH